MQFISFIIFGWLECWDLLIGLYDEEVVSLDGVFLDDEVKIIASDGGLKMVGVLGVLLDPFAQIRIEIIQRSS